jgi:hypothetical protein
VRGEVSEQVVEGSGIVHDPLVYAMDAGTQAFFSSFQNFFAVKKTSKSSK